MILKIDYIYSKLRSMIFFLKDIEGYCYTLDVINNTTIWELKHILKKRHCHKTKPQLYQNKMNLYIFKLFQLSTFKSISDDIILSICNKMKYYPYFYTPICKIHIIFAGRKLEDNKTIEHYNLFRENSPYIIIK